MIPNFFKTYNTREGPEVFSWLGIFTVYLLKVSENIRVLTQMRALSIIEVIFQSVSILFVAYSYVSSPATYKREGPFVTYTVSSVGDAMEGESEEREIAK